MKYLIVVLVALSMSAFAATGRVVVPGSAASFEAPAGFTSLTTEEIGVKYPGDKDPPSHMVGNEKRTTTIAYGLEPFPFTDAQLPGIMAAFSASLEKSTPTLRWVDRKLIDLDGQRWIYLELTSVAPDTDVHSILLITPSSGKALIVELSATNAEFPITGSLLRASLASIRLSDISPVRTSD